MTRTRLVDAGLLAVGTLTRVPVPPPTSVDRATAGRAMALSPTVGAALGLASGAILLIGDADLVARLLTATIVLASAAWLTRGLHLDGLADLADGLGSGAPPERALAIMRRSDIGPFGVLTIVFTIGVQCLSLARIPAGLPALAAWVLAATLGRMAVAAACGPWSRPARENGLGALVVGAVGPGLLGLAGAQTVAVAVMAVTAGDLEPLRGLVAAPLAAMVTTAFLLRLAERRLGGVTGDVLGATIELGCAASLLVLAAR